MVSQMQDANHYNVVIIGAGLAGLSLARQLLLYSDKTILLLEKRAEIPMVLQKYGEATVQLSAYYFSKVLDLEEHLLREHFMKYNLRFYWKTEGSENSRFEEYCQSYIRNLSNIATYQLDRNKLEAEMLRLNLERSKFTFRAGIAGLQVSLSDEGAHSLSYQVGGEQMSATADWIVDTSGRGKFLARKLGLTRQNPIRHGAHFFWVEGLVNLDKLTDLSPKEIRLKKDRAAIGHLPFWLATNHFCGEGFWFWVIPLQGKTSLGLVYDNRLIDREDIASLPQLIDWVCKEFPLFARDLPFRKVLCHSALKDFSHDCAQTISAEHWAMAGEAGRFTDPLYSPGGDLISLYNTLIVDAILTEDNDELANKARLYEQLMRSFYDAYVPSFAVSYYALGDQEAMTLKYTWELAIYFSFYVFPFINDLFTNRRFIPLFLRRFAQLGRVNRNLQEFITAFYHWKKDHCERTRRPIFNDFMEIGALRMAESAFYRVGVSVEEAREVLDEQLANLLELARFIVAHVHSIVLADEGVHTNRSFVERIDLDDFRFEEAEMRESYATHTGVEDRYVWTFDPTVLSRFRTPARASEPFVPVAKEVTAHAVQGGD
jgi:flavin-dependent dehydrogenase